MLLILWLFDPDDIFGRHRSSELRRDGPVQPSREVVESFGHLIRRPFSWSFSYLNFHVGIRPLCYSLMEQARYTIRFTEPFVKIS